jgi:hypothetical protein
MTLVKIPPISQNAGLQTQVANLLSDISDKILSDNVLTLEEIGLLQATRLTIYKSMCKSALDTAAKYA